ncbi:MAG TPA: VWA domain-containing protein [Terriglobales bacterium]
MAQSVAGYPGRKNLIWLSANFPVGLSPQSDTDPHIPNYLIYRREIHETSGMLASGQIAVYPIDVRGVEAPPGIDASLRNAPSQLQIDRQVQAQWNTKFTMTDLAKETGGEAFYNQNDLRSLMQRSLEEGSNYYTLAYVPSDRNWNGKYRKIEIKVAANGAQTRHRSGYYGLPQPAADPDTADHLLALAMQPTVPESTRLVMKAQVLPPRQGQKNISIDFAVAPEDLDFEDGPDQRKDAFIEFSAVALDKNLKQVGIASKKLQASLRRESYERVLRTGFPAHLDLEVPPGTYMLRLGVIDCNNEKIGTLDVPLNVPAESARD